MLGFLFFQQLLRSYPEREFQGLGYVWPEKQKPPAGWRRTHKCPHHGLLRPPCLHHSHGRSKYGSDPFLNLISQLWLCYLSKPWAIWKYLLSPQSPFGNFQADKTQNCSWPFWTRKGRGAERKQLTVQGGQSGVCCHRPLAALTPTGHFICKWSHLPYGFHKVTDPQPRANERQGSGSEATFHWLPALTQGMWWACSLTPILTLHPYNPPGSTARGSWQFLARNKNDMKNHQGFSATLLISVNGKKWLYM